jgi:hypothetical protein
MGAHGQPKSLTHRPLSAMHDCRVDTDAVACLGAPLIEIARRFGSRNPQQRSRMGKQERARPVLPNGKEDRRGPALSSQDLGW